MATAPVNLLAPEFSDASFSHYERLGRVRDFVEEQYPRHISLSDAARVAEMERTSFSKFFHRRTGVRFCDWLTAFRVAKAMEIMSRNNLSIRDIASEVGYRNVRTLQRAFLRLTGRSPIEFKISSRPS